MMCTGSLGQPRRLRGLIQHLHSTARWQTLGTCKNRVLVLFPHSASHLLREPICCPPRRVGPTHTMADSPPSTPDTPRTASPLPSERDLARAFSPSSDDAPTAEMQAHAEGAWMSAPAPSMVNATESAEQGVESKGKEKATKGPLKLLDLPMDILKEIIHQVSRAGLRAAPCRCGTVYADQQLNSFHTQTTSPRSASATRPSIVSRSRAYTRVSTLCGRTRAPTTSLAPAWTPLPMVWRHWSWATTASPTRTGCDYRDRRQLPY